MSLAAADRAGLRVAYLMSRFPKITETFVLYEMLALERLGHRVEVFPLLRQRNAVQHAEAEPFVKRAHFRAHFSLPILRAHLHFLRTRPGAYLRTVHEVLRGTWGSLNYFAGAVALFPKAVRFAFDIKRLDVKHVHAHFANHPTVAALIVHRLTGIPFSFTVHAFDLFVDQTMLAEKIKASSFVVTISEFNRRAIEAACGRAAADKIHVIRCGVDPEVFAPAGTFAAPAENRPFAILCVAALEELKGHRILFQACRMLKARGVRFVCRCVGSGSLESALREQLTRLDLEDSVELLGPRPRTDVARLLGEADAVALASVPTAGGKREGIPVALMEAMAAGRPVVASAMTGLAELIEPGHTGFLVPPADPQALADALETLSRDTALRRRLGEAGREKVRGQFNLDLSARELARLFHGGDSCEASSASASRASAS
jgi:colanic acid/amylovoran biosynthesis glycosyltransferase